MLRLEVLLDAVFIEFAATVTGLSHELGQPSSLDHLHRQLHIHSACTISHSQTRPNLMSTPGSLITQAAINIRSRLS